MIGARDGFQRMYDLPERVIPDAVLGAPVPGEHEAMRAARGPRRRGAAARSTESGVVEHWRLQGRGGRGSGRTSDELVADGHAPARGRRRRRPAGSAAGRGRARGREAERGRCSSRRSTTCSGTGRSPSAVLGFRHLIEVYKPAPERRYGYYVLPLVIGDRVAGRADVKADRKAGVLRLLAWHPESRRRSAARDEALERAFGRLARQLALEPATVA